MWIKECNRNCSKIVRTILENSLSWIHAYYALSCIEDGLCRTTVAYDQPYGPTGVGVFYSIPELGIGVVYYIAVLPMFRRKSLGKAIVASIEELLEDENIDTILATTRRDNTASKRVFEELGYSAIDLEELDETVEELVTMVTCGYEDDILYVKHSGGLDKLFGALLKKDSAYVVENVWRRICYRPWARLRYRTS